MHCIWFIPISCSVYRESKSKSGAGRNASQKLAGTLSCHHFRSLMGASVFAERSVLVQLVDSECLPRGPPGSPDPQIPTSPLSGCHGWQSVASVICTVPIIQRALQPTTHNTHWAHTHTRWMETAHSGSIIVDMPEKPPFLKGLTPPPATCDALFGPTDFVNWLWPICFRRHFSHSSAIRGLAVENWRGESSELGFKGETPLGSVQQLTELEHISLQTGLAVANGKAQLFNCLKGFCGVPAL